MAGGKRGYSDGEHPVSFSKDACHTQKNAVPLLCATHIKSDSINSIVVIISIPLRFFIILLQMPRWDSWNGVVAISLGILVGKQAVLDGRFHLIGIQR